MKVKFFNCWKENHAGWWALTVLRFTWRRIPENNYTGISIVLLSLGLLLEIGGGVITIRETKVQGTEPGDKTLLG